MEFANINETMRSAKPVSAFATRLFRKIPNKYLP